MKGDPEERAVQIGRYLVQSGATVRAAALVFGVSKSTSCQRPGARCCRRHWSFHTVLLLTHSTTMRIRGCTTARATV